ncbi:hypothetical protein IE4872_CH02540 [Rhizobium gallicum]|uniref:Uncharacterized protein n=1 Tax=Rhizobium gallicum TaxID=56730 RepID=A0A1L5NJW5_9HYPH|nr:hypothetical protein IE4872_CH02540 [Rhizobium gallicum]
MSCFLCQWARRGQRDSHMTACKSVMDARMVGSVYGRSISHSAARNSAAAGTLSAQPYVGYKFSDAALLSYLKAIIFSTYKNVRSRIT